MRNVNEAVTFNPVGIGKSMDDYLSKYGSKTPENKVINYNNPNDIFTTLYRKQLVGTNYEIHSENLLKGTHNLENMKPLSTRQKANPSHKSKGQTHSQKGCVGSYQVNGYTRADGTEIKGYTRTCGAKHAGMSKEERLARQEKYKGKRFQDIPLDELEEAISYFI